MNLLGIDRIIQTVGNVFDELHTSPEEKAAVELSALKLETQLGLGQMEVNKMEAQHKSVFVAGWRPAIGWICAIAIGYTFVFHPLLEWLFTTAQAMTWIPCNPTVPVSPPMAPQQPASAACAFKPPPTLNMNQIIGLVLAMLGNATLRTVEKLKDQETNAIRPAQK